MSKVSIEGSAERARDRGEDQLGFPVSDKPSLGDMQVVESVVRGIVGDAVVQARRDYLEDRIGQADAVQRIGEAVERAAAIFYGESPDYQAAPLWNARGGGIDGYCAKWLGVPEDGAAKAVLMHTAALLTNVAVEFEAEAIDEEAVAFRVDVAVEEAVHALMGLQLETE